MPKIQIPTEFQPLFDPQYRTFAIYGGRGSLKSHTVARRLVIAAAERRVRILCTRELQKSIKDSVHKLIADIIEEYEIGGFVILKDSIFNTITGSEFIFTGIRNNTNEIKSMEGIDYCWCEEAHSLTDESINILTPTIRKPGSQIIFTYNRVNELDPVHKKFVLEGDESTCVINVNYDVAIKYGWFPDVLKKEMEADKANNYSLYLHKWLGEPISQTDNAIISRTAIMQAMDRQADDDGQVEVGADIARMGNDRTEFVMRKGYREIDRRTYAKLRTTEVCDKLEIFVDGNKQILIKVDDTGVGGGVTDEMIRRGYNIMPVNFGAKPADPDKYPNLISEAWFYMAEIIDKISLSKDTDLLMELSSRQWVQDSKGRRGVESKDSYKKRGFRSPDKADATILCFYTKNTITMDDIYM